MLIVSTHSFHLVGSDWEWNYLTRPSLNLSIPLLLPSFPSLPPFFSLPEMEAHLLIVSLSIHFISSFSSSILLFFVHSSSLILPLLILEFSSKETTEYSSQLVYMSLWQQVGSNRLPSLSRLLFHLSFQLTHSAWRVHERSERQWGRKRGEDKLECGKDEEKEESDRFTSSSLSFSMLTRGIQWGIML